MRAVTVTAVARICALLLTFSNVPAWSQSRNLMTQCLSISDVDQRVECLENAARTGRTVSVPENRELDCRNPQDAAQCRQLQSGGGIIGGSPQSQAGRANTGVSKPSFDCAKATYPDEYAICSNAELAQLDIIANAGYDYVRLVYGNPYAKSVTLPLLQSRRACGSDVACIKKQQLAAIQKFQSAGAPVNAQPLAAPALRAGPQLGDAIATPSGTANALNQPSAQQTNSDPSSERQQQSQDLTSMTPPSIDREFNRCLLSKGRSGSYSSLDGGKSASSLFAEACKKEFLAWCQAHPEWPDIGPSACKIHAATQAQAALKFLDK